MDQSPLRLVVLTAVVPLSWQNEAEDEQAQSLN